MLFQNFDDMSSGWRIPQLESCARVEDLVPFTRWTVPGFLAKEAIKNLRYASQLFNIAHHRDGSFVGCTFSSRFLVRMVTLACMQERTLLASTAAFFGFVLEGANSHMMDPRRFPSGTYDTAAAPCHQMVWFLSGFCQLKPPMPSLFLGGCDPGEGERFLSRSPLPLPFLLTSCLKLRESPLDQCSSGHTQVTISLLSITTCGFSMASLLAGAPLAVRSFLALKLLHRILSSKIFLTISVKRA